MSTFWKSEIDQATKIEVLIKTPLYGVPTLNHLRAGRTHKFIRNSKTGFKLQGSKYTFSVRELHRQYDNGSIDVNVIDM